MNYSYDNASELTGISYALGQNSMGNLTYSYDLAGRRTSVGGSLAAVNLPNAISTTAYDAANELTQWGTATPTYDANGNTLSDGTNTYVWNARNQLASMNLTGEAFQYDPFGRRTGKTVLGTTTNYLYDGANPVQELSGTTPTANMLTGGVDEYFTRTDSTGTANFLTDALGSTIQLTNSSGGTLASYTYEPFGNTTASGSSTNTYQYTGRENDGTGILFYRKRYYSPSFQRFISEDPSTFKGGINFYEYAYDNPAQFSDPFGLDVTITLYNGAHGFGHMGIGVNTTQTVGFYPLHVDVPIYLPTDDTLVLDLYNFAPIGDLGAVHPDDPSEAIRTITIPTSPNQDQLIQDYINARTLHPGLYNLFGRNCATFVEDALRAGGVRTSDDFLPKVGFFYLTHPSLIPSNDPNLPQFSK